MNSNEFFAALDSRIAQYDLLCHPFYKAWSAGKLTREELREYAREYFHQVNEFPEYLREFAGRLPGGKLRSAVLANHDDEMGRDGGRPHAELWLDFLHGMGGESNSDQAAIAEVGALLHYFHSVAQEGAPEEALAAFYAYESQVPRVAAEKARGLREMYGADEKTCAYFTLHTTADVYHSRVWKQLLGEAVTESPDAAERALSAAESAAKSLWAALDGIEAARLARAA